MFSTFRGKNTIRIGRVDIDEETLEKYSVEYGDVLFQRSSETREEVGTANVYLDKDKKAAFGGFIIRGKKIGEYNPVFINKLLKTSLARKEITTKSGGSTRYNVGQDILVDVELLFPSLNEQNKIASFFSLIDEKIQKQQKKVESLQDYKKGIMQRIFSQEIRFKDENGKEYPEWEEYSIGDIFDFYSTNSYSREYLNDINGEIKNIHYGDIHMNFPTILDVSKIHIPYLKEEVNIDKISPESYCKEGDIIIADASEDYTDIGKTIEVKNVGEEKIVAGLHTMLARDNKGITASGYRGYMFLNEEVKKQIKILAVGSKVLGISKSNIAKVRLNIPSKVEQQKISSIFSLIDEKIEKEQKKLTILDEWKKSLLQQMFV